MIWAHQNGHFGHTPHFDIFFRYISYTTTSNEALERGISENVAKSPSWSENLLLIKSKERAVGGVTVDNGRAFQLMGRIQNKLTNSLDKKLCNKLRVTMYIPKDPAKIDCNDAFEIFKKLRKRYNIDLSKDNKNFEERKKLQGLQMDLS